MSKMIMTVAILGLLAGLPGDASAQDGAKKRGKKEALLKKFDKDGDGKLSDQERAAAKELKAKRRGEEGRGGKLRGKILRRFDQDGDRKLGDAEREALRKFLDSRHKKGRRR